MIGTPTDWATATGDSWAANWQRLDRALEGLLPHLVSAVAVAAPSGPFRAFDVGCGAGASTLALSDERPDADITACDLSPSLVQIGKDRTQGRQSIRVLLGDAETLAVCEGPFDLIFSRHGVMFFPDPVRGFASLRRGAAPGASLIFSCFHHWKENPWASELACAVAERELPPPGREPSGFAFSDPDYVREILGSSGWVEGDARVASFDYVAGDGMEEAMALLSAIGPASAVIRSLPGEEKDAALRRLRQAVECHLDGDIVRFPATAWIWSAKAGSA